MPIRATCSALCFLLPKLALACAVCYGDPQDPVVQSLNTSVLFLLGVIGTVLFMFAAFFIRLYRLASRTTERGE